jgi:hypothetical protein
MKAWMLGSFDDSTGLRRAILRRLGAFVARLFLFGSVFLFHPGERCVYETGTPAVSTVDAPPGLMRQPAADESSVSYRFSARLLSVL